MDNHERLIRTLEHEEPDRVLVHNRGVLPNGSYYQWFMRHYDGDGYFLPEFGDYTVQHESIGQDTIIAGIPTIINYPQVELTGEENPGPHRRFVSPSGHIKDHTVHGGIGYSWYVDGYFTTPEKRDEFYEKHGNPYTDPRYQPGDREYEQFKRKIDAMEKAGYPKVVIGQAGSLFETTFEGMGAGGMARTMRKEPATMDDILGEITDRVLHIHGLMLDAGATVVGIADDLGQKGRGLVSPKNYRRFFKPCLARICKQAHDRGAFTWMHSCGFIENFLPDLIDAGLDAIQSLEPAAGVDISRVKENHGDKITLVGGMDSTRTLSFGSVEEVIADVKHCLEVAMPGGGYIAGPSHRIIDCPPENVQAMKEIIQRHGRYD